VIEHTSNGCTCIGKRCPRCDQIKCRGAFGRNWLKKDGLQVYCTACRVAHKRADRPARRDKDRAIGKAWYQKNQEHARVQHKAYREAHPNKRSKEHYEAKWEKYREANKGYYEAHRDEHRERLTVDHVVPLSQGSRNSIENLQPLCRACNISKHARTIDYRPYFRRWALSSYS
jgi:5-methylcytosine-specific restriction endonuclease McrA